MENALLIGLSRQIALQRELDVVANNIANINTTGFKADGAVFDEYLSAPAARRRPGPTSRVSFVQDRATWHDMSQGPIQHTGNPLDVAIDGQGFLVVQTARGERYTRNGALQINATGELVTSAGDQVLGDSGPISLAADRPRHLDHPRRHHQRARGRQPNSDTTARQAAAGHASTIRSCCRRTAPAPSSRRTASSRSRRPSRSVVQGAIEKSNVRARDRNDAHDRSHAHLYRGRQHPAAAKRPADNCDRQARRRSGLAIEGGLNRCAHSTPPPPA